MELYTEDKLERIRGFFAGDRYATSTTGIEILEAGPGYARTGLKLDDRHMNAVGIVMGAVYYTMADFTFAVVSNAESAARQQNTGADTAPAEEAVKAVPAVSLGANITYLAPARGKYLYAECRAVREGRRTCFYRTQVTDELGTLIAEVSTSGFRVG